MLKQQIIQHYLSSENIEAIIPQHHGKAFELMIKYVGMWILIRIFYSWMSNLLEQHTILWRLAILWLTSIFILFNYHFMMLYLDSIVITWQGIIIMDQVWLCDFKQTRFDRESIQTIGYHQHWIADWFLNKWDITIGIEHGTNYILPNVIQPTKRVDRLNHHKHQAIIEQARKIAIEQESIIETPQYDKFELLVEKLSDIIVDYMQQPRTSDSIIEWQLDETEDDYPTLYKS